MVALVSALKRVDLPTFGKPTMPHLNPMVLPAGETKKKRETRFPV
jgi:hypothetical protein